MKETQIDNLIVPINIQALCVGSEDSTQNAFIKREADFSQLPYVDSSGGWQNYKANISENILTNPFEDDQTSLEQGIHLHWALPDALTNGEAQDNLKFPLVPNRWLVVRIPFDNSNNPLTIKSWIIESDALSTNQNNSSYITVPVNYGQTNTQPYNYLGAVYDTSNWQENSSGQYYSNFTALGYGAVNFASCYQNCRSIFGLYDDVSDLPSETVNCTYLVIGWYSNSKNDFLRTISNGKGLDELVEQWLADNSWSIANNAEFDIANANSLYSGFVKNVAWNATNTNSTYLDISSANATVVFAESSIEALSAFISETYASDNRTIVEDLFNALQLGLLKNNSPNLTELDYKLHLKRFSQHSGSIIWTIVPGKENTGNDINIPLELADPLNQINILQQSYDRLTFSIQSLQYQIFSDWYKYMVVSYGNPPSNAPSAQDIQNFITNEITNSLNTLSTQKDDLLKKINNFQNNLKGLISNYDTLELKQAPTSRYYSPIDPTILLVNQDESWTYAGERNFTADGILSCRVSSQIVVSTGEVQGYLSNSNLPFLNDFNSLINEAIILTQSSNLQNGEVLPESIAINDWRQIPWLPLSLEWEAYYIPLAKANGNYDTNHIVNNFNFDQDANELTYSTTVNSSIFGQQETYRGCITLTPNTTYNLCERINEYLQYYPDSPYATKLQQAVDKIQKIPTSQTTVLAQILNGFNKALIMSKQTLQLQVYDPFDSTDNPFTNTTVQRAVGNQNISAPVPIDSFNPIIDGISCISRLRIIDAFGRYKDIPYNKIIYPSSANTYVQQGSNYIALYPRIVQPCRLQFEFLATDSKEAEANKSPAVNPICGWILINNINNALMFYDATGVPIGMLQVGQSKAIWRSAPSIYPFDTSLDACFLNKNAELYNLAKTIYNGVDNPFEYLSNLFKVIDSTCTKIVSKEQFFSNPALLGKPLALVQASIQLQLQGLSAVNESWDALSTDILNSNPLNRTNNQFTTVNFPVQLGDYQNFQDGLVGYFVSGGDDVDYSTFYSSETMGDNIQKSTNLLLQPYSIISKQPAKIISMLVDPTVPINANIGILPVTTISIPPDQYVQTLKNMYITFLTAPVISAMITSSSSLTSSIPLSKENGANWTWVQAQKQPDNSIKWTEVAITPDSTIFANNKQIIEGWLKLNQS
ncbi:hypothetical protein NF27_DC00050 [Candidatus Jidaibacter acanthamoeba]|uniref:Uncharacterized protein n=1 Tax=Candidatus Jidaibacter acanthamoebae TaxID=86105 RepID=A0A0C1N084_9RICK|nr:hypothetical protein [Candidatus Jidaibacter acanthamoeba]KIE05726.1 hypothetical protein NF27_DC00050 [Candidatus Jidaibacter acanthamoeba]